MLKPPGEVHHEKGRDRSKLFGACLQQIVRGFRAEFYSTNGAHAARLNVEIPMERKFSFDILGRLHNAHNDCLVWIEAKGYDGSGKLLQQYRNFVSNVALARIYHSRFDGDLFWFVSSAPFACDLGAKIATSQWIQNTILNSANSQDGIVYPDEVTLIEERGFDDLSRYIRALILTPELMKTTGLKHFAEAGDDLWRITENLYGGVVPLPYYQPYANSVAKLNKIPSPDDIQIGQELELPFLGWPWPAEEEVK